MEAPRLSDARRHALHLLPAALSLRLHRLDGRRVWFGRLRYAPGPTGGTLELTGWRGLRRFRRVHALGPAPRVHWSGGHVEDLHVYMPDESLRVRVDSPGLLHALFGTRAPGRRPEWTDGPSGALRRTSIVAEQRLASVAGG